MTYWVLYVHVRAYMDWDVNILNRFAHHIKTMDLLLNVVSELRTHRFQNCIRSAVFEFFPYYLFTIGYRGSSYRITAYCPLHRRKSPP
jgi:hypothetical protein